MIKVTYITDGISHDLMLQGHAGYAPHGEDIVCAAVSGIIYSLLGWLENNEYELLSCDTHVKGGDVHIYCEGGDLLAAVMDMTIIGLEQIEHQYPEHVVIGEAD